MKFVSFLELKYKFFRFHDELKMRYDKNKNKFNKQLKCSENIGMSRIRNILLGAFSVLFLYGCSKPSSDLNTSVSSALDALYLDLSFGSAQGFAAQGGTSCKTERLIPRTNGGYLAIASASDYDTHSTGCLLALNSNGTADSSMKTIVIAPVGGLRKSSNIFDAAELPNSKILILYSDGTNQYLARYSSTTGDLDTSFGSSGIILLTSFVADVTTPPYFMAVQSTGKVILFTKNMPGSAAVNSKLIRIDQDGNVDSSFGVSGFATVNFQSSHHLILLPDDRILVEGDYYSIARFTADGLTDPSFSNGTGYVSPPLPSSAGTPTVALQKNGKIILSSRAGIIQLLEDGNTDSGFGSNGVITPESGSEFISLTLQSDGKILVANSNNTGDK